MTSEKHTRHVNFVTIHGEMGSQPPCYPFLFSQNEAVTSMLVNQGVTILGLLKTFMVAFRKTLSLDSALKKTTVNYISL